MRKYFIKSSSGRYVINNPSNFEDIELTPYGANELMAKRDAMLFTKEYADYVVSCLNDNDSEWADTYEVV